MNPLMEIVGLTSANFTVSLSPWWKATRLDELVPVCICSQTAEIWTANFQENIPIIKHDGWSLDSYQRSLLNKGNTELCTSLISTSGSWVWVSVKLVCSCDLACWIGPTHWIWLWTNHAHWSNCTLDIRGLDQIAAWASFSPSPILVLIGSIYSIYDVVGVFSTISKLKSSLKSFDTGH